MSTDPPAWWTVDLAGHMERVLTDAWPAETGGLVIQAPGRGPSLWTPGGVAAPRWFAADPDEVVQFALTARREGIRVLATFHSHPDGRRWLSERDRPMLWWAEWHVLGVPGEGAWRFLHWRRGFRRESNR
ncbi:Mov34/MPN/PAD-1 family protein [Alicyclobacillus sp.]|uniref:Mov34/MPN/PAD-1 family protein n=1 Tax=Alicyclobacillus sp. TaxID=61169 RepID=UPI0025C482C1|nr:Mov34/MPN/PAD-1 family protein [Alicyclobacillus sp.]MCL6516167.1 Mov34/MPN/PAD-1 family protein [Alicyclobacillus sp.]